MKRKRKRELEDVRALITACAAALTAAEQLARYSRTATDASDRAAHQVINETARRIDDTWIVLGRLAGKLALPAPQRPVSMPPAQGIH